MRSVLISNPTNETSDEHFDADARPVPITGLVGDEATAAIDQECLRQVERGRKGWSSVMRLDVDERDRALPNSPW